MIGNMMVMFAIFFRVCVVVLIFVVLRMGMMVMLRNGMGFIVSVRNHTDAHSACNAVDSDANYKKQA